MGRAAVRRSLGKARVGTKKAGVAPGGRRRQTWRGLSSPRSMSSKYKASAFGWRRMAFIWPTRKSKASTVGSPSVFAAPPPAAAAEAGAAAPPLFPFFPPFPFTSPRPPILLTHQPFVVRKHSPSRRRSHCGTTASTSPQMRAYLDGRNRGPGAHMHFSKHDRAALDGQASDPAYMHTCNTCRRITQTRTRTTKSCLQKPVPKGKGQREAEGRVASEKSANWVIRRLGKQPGRTSSCVTSFLSSSAPGPLPSPLKPDPLL